MDEKTLELERLIAEKNSMLNLLDEKEKRNSEKIKLIKIELDKLLYMYYKSLISKFTTLSFL